jgi:Predicted multitransmembrane protein
MTEQSTKKSLLKGLQRLVLGLIIVLATWWWLSSSAQEIFQKQQTKQQQAQQTAAVEYQLPAVAYYKAKISNELSKNNEVTSLGTEMSKQNLEAVLLEGPEAGQTINLEVYLYKHMAPLTKGQTIVVRQISFPNNQKDISYSFVDIYRLESAAYLVLIFIVLVIILAGFQGLTSFMGLSFSIVVLLWFFLPQIINGGNVYWLTGITSLVILLVSVYLAHGLNKKSIISTLSIILTISLAALFSVWAVALTKLSGFSTEEAVYLASSQWHQYLDLRGLLLAGIIIGTIGLLDDVAITQAATVEELHKATLTDY